MKEAYLYGKFSDTHLNLLKKGIILYNDEFYWECHEELEDHWIEDTGDNARYVYWAVIQVATSLYHYLDGNLNGAEGMLKKAKRKLDSCEKLQVETDILEKSLNWAEFKKRVREIPEKSSLEDYNTLYEFKFRHPKDWK